MKQFLLFLVLQFAIFCETANAQYFKNYNKDYVYETDTCSIVFNFGNAKFHSFAQFTSFITSVDGSGGNIYTRVDVLNDSALEVIIPPVKGFSFGNKLLLNISARNQSFDYQNLVDRLPINILSFVPNSQIYCLPSNRIFDLDSLNSFAMLTLNGKGTHFLEPETEFGYEKNFPGGGFTKLDSVQIISDTLAYLFFPKPKENTVANFGIQYRNKKDGPRFYFSSISFRNSMFGTDKINMEVSATPRKINTNNTVQSAVEIKLIENSYFNPDTLSRLIKPSLQLANYNGEILPITYEADSMVFDSFTYFLDGGPYLNRARFYFKIPIHQSLASGAYDLVINHSQLAIARVPAQIEISRPQPIVTMPGFAFPGKNFQIEIRNPYATLDTNGIQFKIANNPLVQIDSFRVWKEYNYVYGHTDSLALNGSFKLLIKQANRPEILLQDALKISQTLPLLLRFYPHNRLVTGRADSTKRLSSDGYSGIKLGRKMPVIRFLKDGNLYPSISITGASEFLAYNQVYFQVDSTVLQGYYDAEVFDSISNKWWLQKEAVYVMGSVRAKHISPNVVATSGIGFRQFTCWFKGSHFTQAKDIKAGDYFIDFSVINDTCITFKGITGVPAFYNEVDGYIGNDFNMTIVFKPSLTQFAPNWIAKGTKMQFTLNADASSWSDFPENLVVYFERENIFEQNLKVSNYEVINDTTLLVDVEASDILELGLYDLVLYQTGNFLKINKYNALNAVATSLNPIKESANLKPQIYPNPSSGNLEGNFAKALFSKLEILSIEGKVLYMDHLQSPHFSIELQDILPSSGIYFLRLSGAQNYTQKIFFNP
jgi:hypothetical protein